MAKVEIKSDLGIKHKETAQEGAGNGYKKSASVQNPRKRVKSI